MQSMHDVATGLGQFQQDLHTQRIWSDPADKQTRSFTLSPMGCRYEQNLDCRVRYKSHMMEILWQHNHNLVTDIDGVLMRQLAEPIKAGNVRAMAFAGKVAEVWMKQGTKDSVYNALCIFEELARKGVVSNACP